MVVQGCFPLTENFRLVKSWTSKSMGRFLRFMGERYDLLNWKKKLQVLRMAINRSR